MTSLHDPTPPDRRRLPRAVTTAAALGLVIHTLGVLWVWARWAPGPRGTWLVWMDLPASLLYLQVRDGLLLGLSLVVGGLEWALWGALASAAVGLLSRRPPEPPPEVAP